MVLEEHGGDGLIMEPNLTDSVVKHADRSTDIYLAAGQGLKLKRILREKKNP